MRALPFLLSALLASSPLGQSSDNLPTLEARLAEMRAKASAERERVRLPLEALIARAEALTKGGKAQEQLALEMAQLGHAAAPLLVGYLDPGAEPSDGQRRRAATAADALVQLPLETEIDALLALLETASVHGRRHALRVLGASGLAGQAAIPVLVGFAQDPEHALRLEAFQALLQIGGPQADATAQGALQDPALAPSALTALAASGACGAGHLVRPLLAQASSSAMLPQLIAFYARCSEELSKDEFSALFLLAARGELEATPRMEAFQDLSALGATRFAFDNAWREACAPILTTSNAQLRVETLLCLALLGDKSSRRTLLKEFDAPIADQPRWYASYAQRGGILLRLGDNDEALRDFKKALELALDHAVAEREDIYLGLARAQARTGRLRDASETIDAARLSAKRLRELALDADFHELAAHPRFGKVFPPPER